MHEACDTGVRCTTRQHGDDGRTRDGRTHRGALQHRKDSAAGQNRGAAPRRSAAPHGRRAARTARHTNRAGPSVAMARRLGTERQAYVVPALAPYAIPQGAIPKVQSPKPRNAPTTSFFAAGSAVLAAVRFYSRPQAAGCLVGCSADVENIGSWRRAADAK